jgi:hypothetical protein
MWRKGRVCKPASWRASIQPKIPIPPILPTRPGDIALVAWKEVARSSSGPEVVVVSLVEGKALEEAEGEFARGEATRSEDMRRHFGLA